MLKRSRLTLAVSAAIGRSTATILPKATQAQENTLLEEVVVTGSMIKRIDLDNALPVQVLSAEEISRIAVTNATELIEKIPAMLTASDSVGGSGGGLRTANLRGIGDQY
jgi:iron complex outermembrane receptor protein